MTAIFSSGSLSVTPSDDGRRVIFRINGVIAETEIWLAREHVFDLRDGLQLWLEETAEPEGPP